MEDMDKEFIILIGKLFIGVGCGVLTFILSITLFACIFGGKFAILGIPFAMVIIGTGLLTYAKRGK